MAAELVERLLRNPNWNSGKRFLSLHISEKVAVSSMNITLYVEQVFHGNGPMIVCNAHGPLVMNKNDRDILNDINM